MNPDPHTITRYRRRYEEELFERVIPFWVRHSPDEKNGGTFNNLGRCGAVYDTTKHTWLQARQAWMLSTLYRTAEPRDEWLRLARSGLDFLREHACRPDGRAFFSLTADGRPIYQQRKIFSECFYAMALAGVGRAAAEPALLQEAKDLLAQIWAWSNDLSLVGRPKHAGQPSSQALAVPMILLNLIEEIAGDDWPDYTAEVDDCLARIQKHVHAETQTVREHVAPDGGLVDGPDGRLLNPGHALEAGWFVHHWARRLGRDDLYALADSMVRWSFRRGWDDTHGGLFYFLDAEKGRDPVQLEWHMKLWWPHCEALYAHLLGYARTGVAGAWDAFAQVDAYAFEHFADPAHGEWFGYLDRAGRPTHRFKGGPYKGCFHVPRSLWLCWRVLKRLEERS